LYRAKNGLESYAYKLLNSLNDQNITGKMDAANKLKLHSAITETNKWLDALQEVSKEEYDHHAEVLRPGGPGGFPGGTPGGFPEGAPSGFPVVAVLVAVMVPALRRWRLKQDCE
jgi:L1 cell adhesion molecule like protein